MIAVRRVVKRYGSSTILGDVTLSIPRGGVTSIIGPNGAGKSTLLSIIGRLVAATSGSVEVDSLNVATTPGDVLARRLAILQQNPQVASRLTVSELVAFGRYPHSKGRPRVDDHEHVRRAMAYLDVVGLSDRYVEELSGGQRQRVFLAMVLCQDTDYLLLDEPLNGLDLKHAVATMRSLRRFADELGKTIVLVLHDLNFASSYSDLIVAMRNGGVLFEGAPASVIREDRLRVLYDTDVTVHDVEGRRIVTLGD